MKSTNRPFTCTITTKDWLPKIHASIRLTFVNGMPKEFAGLDCVVRKARTVLREIHGPRLQKEAQPTKFFRNSHEASWQGYYANHRRGCQVFVVVGADETVWLPKRALRRTAAEISQVFVHAPLTILYSNLLNRVEKRTALEDLDELLGIFVLTKDDDARMEIRKMIRRLTGEAQFGQVNEETFSNSEPLLRL